MARTAASLRMYLGALFILLAGVLVTQTGLATAVVATTSVLAVTLLCGAVVAATTARPATARGTRTAFLRGHERRTTVVPQRDQDTAAGRRRPNAPGRLAPTTGY